jgi:ribosomal protein S18 acetylase RimI-like enzyme
VTEKEIKIEQLEASDKTEAVKVLIQAFSGIRSSALATRSRIIRILVNTLRILVNTLKRVLGQNIGMRAKLVLFGGFANFLTYGIRKDGKLVCVAILSDAEKSSKRLPILSMIVLWPLGSLIYLVLRVGRMLKWRTAIELERVGKEMSEYCIGYCKGRYFELLVFGTLPAYQKQGFGREMLRFIRKMAESKGFKGIQLSTVRDSPAFRLYIQEGFIVEKEFNLVSQNVIIMRLTFLENPPPTATRRQTTIDLPAQEDGYASDRAR